jgi:hypothetical protein
MLLCHMVLLDHRLGGPFRIVSWCTREVYAIALGNTW